MNKNEAYQKLIDNNEETKHPFSSIDSKDMGV